MLIYGPVFPIFHKGRAIEHKELQVSFFVDGPKRVLQGPQIRDHGMMFGTEEVQIWHRGPGNLRRSSSQNDKGLVSRI